MTLSIVVSHGAQHTERLRMNPPHVAGEFETTATRSRTRSDLDYYDLIKKGGTWVFEKRGSYRPLRIGLTEAETLKKVEAYMRTRSGCVRVYAESGEIEDEWTYQLRVSVRHRFDHSPAHKRVRATRFMKPISVVQRSCVCASRVRFRVARRNRTVAREHC